MYTITFTFLSVDDGNKKTILPEKDEPKTAPAINLTTRLEANVLPINEQIDFKSSFIGTRSGREAAIQA